MAGGVGRTFCHGAAARSLGFRVKRVDVTAAEAAALPMPLLVAVHPADAETAWFVPAVSDMCRVPVDGALCVNRTRDGGRTWDTLREGLPQRDCYDLVYRHGLDVASDGRSLLIGSTTGGLCSSDDGGDRWQAVSLNLPPIAAVRFG